MGYLAGFTWARRAGVVAAALDAAHADGAVLVVGPHALARALLQHGRETFCISGSGVKARLRDRTLRARADALPIADGALAGLVAATGDPPHEEWNEWLRAVRKGGAVVLVASLTAEEQCRRALCAGLADIEQRRAGTLLITSGTIWCA